MNDYTKGILTGGSLILCFFMFVSAQSESKNLGDIKVTSLTVLDENEKAVAKISSIDNGGYLALTKAGREYNSVLLYCVDEGGAVSTLNSDGKSASTLGVGWLKTFNADGKERVFLGTNNAGIGHLITFNGDNKVTTVLGTDNYGVGNLRTYNTNESEVGFFGSNRQGDGLIELSDRYENLGWAESGRR